MCLSWTLYRHKVMLQFCHWPDPCMVSPLWPLLSAHCLKSQSPCSHWGRLPFSHTCCFTLGTVAVQSSNGSQTTETKNLVAVQSARLNVSAVPSGAEGQEGCCLSSVRVEILNKQVLMSVRTAAAAG